MAKLKVFAANLGFFETVVAAPSKAAALKAWGARQDLFGQGVAAPATDTKAAEAALAEPGVVLRRAAGSCGAFEKDPGLGGLSLPKARPKAASKDRPAPAPRPPPDRSALTAAEAALLELDRRFETARDHLADRRKALDAEAADLRAAYQRDRKAMESARQDAVAAYRKLAQD